MNRAHKPEVFRLDDPAIVVMPAVEVRRPAGNSTARSVADGTAVSAIPSARSRRVPWATIFWASAAGLLLLATGLGVANLIADLFARAAWLGGVGTALAAAAVDRAGRDGDPGSAGPRPACHHRRDTPARGGHFGER